MIKYLPHHSEVLVSSMTCEEVISRLDHVTRDVDYLSDPLSGHAKECLFNGKINEASFRLSMAVRKADSFLPLIKGKLESTRTGCIIFLDYQLFPGSSFFMMFWSIVTLAMGMFFLFGEEQPAFAMISFAVGVGNVVFAWSHFKRKVKHSQEIFHKMLSLQKNS
ncbi:hypothetical protein [Echinicola rosea]|uniref:Uncharacterized protein n=1 Tax=Echinicola rosea TaxID=1807691 RepID=A0ABQ1V1F3_9BACT|nr:hypothetical protein [Echinicola rosea]GGF34627.1 hypothetical protein GCM10011339_23610 [Echinicola rosea]